MLSNLLQELTLAKDSGRKHIVLDEARLNENPVQRLSRLIRYSFWPNLTRRIDASSIGKAGRDPKDWTDDPRPRIYIPESCQDQVQYYEQLARDQPLIRLDVQVLTPYDLTPEGIRDLNDKPGLLALAMEEWTSSRTAAKESRGLPFVVPGGRFNEVSACPNHSSCFVCRLSRKTLSGEDRVLYHHDLPCNLKTCSDKQC